MKIDNNEFKFDIDAPLPWDFKHELRAMNISLNKDEERQWTLFINEVNFNELPEAPAREREPLARSKTSINMSGVKKVGYYPILLSGKLIPVSVQLNQFSKFSKLQVGK